MEVRRLLQRLFFNFEFEKLRKIRVGPLLFRF